MAGTRVTIDLFFKDKTPSQINTEFPQLLTVIKAAKSKASLINAGLPNGEMAVKATYHICRHDEIPQKPCDPEQQI